MPNAEVLKKKQEEVEALASRISAAEAGVFIDYKGINVSQDTALRAELRKNGIEYSVIKNTLTRFAFRKTGFESLEHILEGTTSLATGTGDPIVPVRIVSEYAKKLGDIFNVKACFIEGKVISKEQIEEIAKLESKESLYSVAFGTLLAPITSLAVVLGQILEQKGGSLGEPETAEAAAE